MVAATLFDPDPLQERTAVLSTDGLYRYALSRAWGVGPLVTWVLLNPSSATAELDDPTVRRLLGYSCLWKMGRLAVVNLFAWRATDPAELDAAPDPVGPENLAAIDEWVRRAHLVVVGWGKEARRRPLRPHNMPARAAQIVRTAGKTPMCLGVNLDGSPKHPLYLRNDAEILCWA